MTTLVTPESLVNILGTVYVHNKTSDGGDIYLTSFGLQYADILELENWYERDWFVSKRERLEGTSAVYRVPTKVVKDRSLELVVKNCRVGEDVPVQTRTLLEFLNAEFNSPWEEFALVMEMREGRYGPEDVKIHTQEPLAIYVPPETMQIWQSGRSQEKINRIQARHPGIDLDILRQYKLVYGWIHGKSAVDIFLEAGLTRDDLKPYLEPITHKTMRDMEQKGYVVADMKPEHVIVPEAHLGEIEAAGDGAGPETIERKAAALRRLVDAGKYAIIDYELLLRTPNHEEEVTFSRRHSYLDDQRDRFVATPLPSHLEQTEIFGVPYIFGHTEATGGNLWVVGRNARLFDYFLPERWRKTHSWRLSEHNDVHYTFTKDHVHIVWKTSRVGEVPAGEDGDEWARKAREFGFNSPFEEFAIAQRLQENGVPTVYVRAVYMTGTPKLEPSVDRRRFESHRIVLDPEGLTVLRADRNYITVRGYYNGSDRWVAQQKGKLCRPVDLEKGVVQGFIKEGEARRVFDATLSRLRNLGCDGSLLEPNDLLLALDPEGRLLQDDEGYPEARICNFELIHEI
jgi:hypothetical protein